MKKKAPKKVRRPKQISKPRKVSKPKPRVRNAPPVALDSLLTPIVGADRREIGGVAIDIIRAGNGRIKRVVYPRGFRWSTHLKPTVGTDLCMHAHVGFLARGRCAIQVNASVFFSTPSPARLPLHEQPHGVTGRSAWLRRWCANGARTNDSEKVASSP